MKVAISNDHAGVKMKNALVDYMKDNNIEVINFGTDIEQSVDYPDFASKTALAIQRGEAQLGIVICGTGIGASITANKYKGVHAALCHNIFTATMAKRHNNANVLAMGARVLSITEAINILKVFLKETFEGGRHSNRVEKIYQIEEKNFCN